MLQLSALNLIAGDKLLLSGASASFSPGQSIGIVGRNGAGKSTLFRAIENPAILESGTISYPSDWQIATLSQELPNCDGSVLEAAIEGDAYWLGIQARLEKAEEDNDANEMATCHEIFAQIDGYTIEARASKICRGLGFSIDELKKPVKEFSGGWQMRVQLARVLISRADLMLLDEPTNHLDLESAVWLESWLKKQRALRLIISHDRDFLDSTTTDTLHLSQEKFKTYKGGYTAFAKQRHEQLENESKMAAKQETKRDHMQSFVDRFRASAAKAKQAQSRLKALEKLTFSGQLEEESGFSFSFEETKPIPYPAVTLRGNLGYDDKIILKGANFNIGTGERLGIIGRNGSGKTTFLRSLFGELPVLTGECIVQPDVRLGYFSQQQVDVLSPNDTPFEVIRRLDERARESKIRSYLGGFGFQGDKVFDSIKLFSGGEKARVALAALVFQEPNILILDEPTNHLDITMREALIMALQQYDGALLVVSHDRHLLNSCVDQFILVGDGTVRPFEGGFLDYQKSILDGPSNTDKSKQNKSSKKGKQSGKRLSQLEKSIEKLTREISDIESSLMDKKWYEPEHTAILTKMQNDLKEKTKKLGKSEEEWLNLSVS